VWTAIERYLHSAYQEIAESPSSSNASQLLAEITWGLYILALATRDHCEVPLDPKRVISAIDGIAGGKLSRESKARLSTVRGIFTLFSDVSDIPGFRCIAQPSVTLRNRIDEIMEDAYLLEASQLRRFFGVGANVAAIKRDLDKLLRFIAKNRPWAKGVLKAVSSTVPLAKTPADISATLLDIVPSLQVDGSAPLLVEPRPHHASIQAFAVVTSHRLAFSSSERWAVTVQRCGP
jgi:hypothetical protein